MRRFLSLLSLLLAPCLAAAEPLGPEEHLFELINADRRLAGVPVLSWSEELAEVARLHAQDMRFSGVASHDSLRDGSSYSERLDRTGLPAQDLSENVALAGDLLNAHLWLMASAENRAKVLDPELTHVGLGVEETSDGLAVFVVEDFVRLPPDWTEDEAARELRRELGDLPRRLESLPLREAEELSSEAQRLSREMARRGLARAPGLPEIEHDVAYFYDTLDPSVLPETVAEIAPDALDYGLGITRGEQPGAHEPNYWVVVIFRDVL